MIEGFCPKRSTEIFDEMMGDRSPLWDSHLPGVEREGTTKGILGRSERGPGPAMLPEVGRSEFPSGLLPGQP